MAADLSEAGEAGGLVASELVPEAGRPEVHRQHLVEQTDAYVEALVAEVGEPTAEELARAEVAARALRGL